MIVTALINKPQGLNRCLSPGVVLDFKNTISTSLNFNFENFDIPILSKNKSNEDQKRGTVAGESMASGENQSTRDGSSSNNTLNDFQPQSEAHSFSDNAFSNDLKNLRDSLIQLTNDSFSSVSQLISSLDANIIIISA